MLAWATSPRKKTTETPRREHHAPIGFQAWLASGEVAGWSLEVDIETQSQLKQDTNNSQGFKPPKAQNSKNPDNRLILIA
jgi:hypothetical protein